MADFDTWLVDELVRLLPITGGRMRGAVMRLFEKLLVEAGISADNQRMADLERVLFDPRHVRSLVGVSIAVVRGEHRALTPLGRLMAAGLPRDEVATIPILAFRLKALYDRLSAEPAPTWSELCEVAALIPLSTVEQRAAVIARRLRPPLLAGPFLNEAVARAIETRQSTREASRHAENALRKLGTPLATEAFFRTRVALAHSRARFEVDRASWTDDTLIYRTASATPCRQCLRLHYGPDGFPRLYRVADVDRGRARWPNRGPRRRWKVTIGPVHDNCVCPPWTQWTEILRETYARRAPDRVALMRRLGLL